MSYVYPQDATPAIVSHRHEDIAELCLPDGGHKRSSDCIFILLTAEHNIPLYGFAYFRNRSSAEEKRGAKQLALLVVATSPYFDRFRPFLTVAIEEYLDCNQSKTVIHQLYGALEKSYRRTRRLAAARHKSYDSADLILESSDEEDAHEVTTQPRTRPPSAQYSVCRRSTASIISRVDLESLTFGEPIEDYDEELTSIGGEALVDGLNAGNRLSLNSHATAQMLETHSEIDHDEILPSSQEAFDDGIIENGVRRNSIYFGKLSKVQNGRHLDHLGVLSSSCTYTMHLWGRMFVMQPLITLRSNEFGGISLKEVVLKFRVQTMALWTALISLRRILVCGPESQAESVGSLVLATPLLLGPLGALIIPNLIPYATLANVEPVTTHSSYVCGTTNGLFATKEDWYDIVVDPKTGKTMVSNTSTIDRNLLKVQGGDLAFINRVLDGIENGKRDEDWVRFEFATYTQDFLDSVREIELERQAKRSKEEGSTRALPVHGHSASDASSTLSTEAMHESDSSRLRLRSVQLWRSKPKSSFLKRSKTAKTASDKLARTFAGSPLWLRYRWMQLNPESYSTTRKHLSRIHVVSAIDTVSNGLPPQLPKRPKGWTTGPQRPVPAATSPQAKSPKATSTHPEVPKHAQKTRTNPAKALASVVVSRKSKHKAEHSRTSPHVPVIQINMKDVAKACISQRDNMRASKQLRAEHSPTDGHFGSQGSGKSQGIFSDFGDPTNGSTMDDFGSSSGRSFSSEESIQAARDRTAAYVAQQLHPEDGMVPPPPDVDNKWRTAMTPEGKIYLWHVDTKETKWAPSEEPDTNHLPPQRCMNNSIPRIQKETFHHSYNERLSYQIDVDDDDGAGASKWVMLKGRWQRVTVLMQEDVGLKTLRKSDWVEAYTESGEKFWHNLRTGISQWDFPGNTTASVA